MLPDYYRSLQVDPSAEHEVIEAAYRRLARKYHPDVNRTSDAVARMRELNAAYAVLGDARRRAEYDAARLAWSRADALRAGNSRSPQSWERPGAPVAPSSPTESPGRSADPAPSDVGWPRRPWRSRRARLLLAVAACVVVTAYAIGNWRSSDGYTDAEACAALARIGERAADYPGDTGLAAVASVGRNLSRRSGSVLRPLFARLESASIRPDQVEAGAAIFRKCGDLGIPIGSTPTEDPVATVEPPAARAATASDGVGRILERSLAEEGIAAEVLACSQPVPAAPHVKFTCSIRLKDAAAAAILVEVERTGRAGGVNWDIPGGMVDVTVIRPAVLQWVRAQGYPDARTLSCGGRWKVPRQGSTFECVAGTDGGAAVPMVMTVTDARGTVSWTLKHR